MPCWGSGGQLSEDGVGPILQASDLLALVSGHLRPRDQPPPLQHMGRLRPRAVRFLMECSGKNRSLRRQGQEDEVGEGQPETLSDFPRPPGPSRLLLACSGFV